MNRILRFGPALAALGAALAAVFVATAASAQVDGLRFRGGVALEGGALILPGKLAMGGGAVVGQLGVQIDDRWALYALPSFDAFAGDGSFVSSAGSALMAELTVPGAPLSIAAGPDAAALLTVSGESGGLGYSLGGRLRLAVHPLLVRAETGPRRRALSVGVDLRVAEINLGGADNTSVTFTPTAFIGYTAF